MIPRWPSPNDTCHPECLSRKSPSFHWCGRFAHCLGDGKEDSGWAAQRWQRLHPQKRVFCERFVRILGLKFGGQVRSVRKFDWSPNPLPFGRHYQWLRNNLFECTKMACLSQVLVPPYPGADFLYLLLHHSLAPNPLALQQAGDKWLVGHYNTSLLEAYLTRVCHKLVHSCNSWWYIGHMLFLKNYPSQSSTRRIGKKTHSRREYLKWARPLRLLDTWKPLKRLALSLGKASWFSFT